jgi:hypothetical protein
MRREINRVEKERLEYVFIVDNRSGRYALVPASALSSSIKEDITIYSEGLVGEEYFGRKGVRILIAECEHLPNELTKDYKKLWENDPLKNYYPEILEEAKGLYISCRFFPQGEF